MRVFLATALAVLATDTWVPIRVVGGYQYFNPESGLLQNTIPLGDHRAPPVEFVRPGGGLLQSPEEIADASAEEPDVPVSQSQSSSASAVEAGTEAGVTLSDSKSCYPRCSWNCTQPICNQDCHPECEQPTCQTRCPKPDYSACGIDCGTPHCSVFCPPDPCHSNPGTKCSSPKCSTQCARAVCALKCKNRVPCNNVCHPPRCTWNCRNPRACPKPECKLVCERPLGCAQTYELPPLSPALTVQQSFSADRARWVTYEWSRCGVKCGKATKTRKVVCSAGDDSKCQFGVKPSTEAECEDMSGCNQWKKGTWGKCSAVCGKGKMSRKVWCDNDDNNECFGDKPVGVKECFDDGEHCNVCHVTLYGGPYFNGWTASYEVGEYDTQALIAKGAKCEEVSSMKVSGACCRATVYQYGDFNTASNGWSATFKKGKHDVHILEAANVRDNDISSMEVYFAEDCGSARKHMQLTPYLSNGDTPVSARARARRARMVAARSSTGSPGAVLAPFVPGLDTNNRDTGMDPSASTDRAAESTRAASARSAAVARDATKRTAAATRRAFGGGEEVGGEVGDVDEESRRAWDDASRAGEDGMSGWGGVGGAGGGDNGGSSGQPSKDKGLPLWFWLVIGVLTVVVIGAVVMACRRR
mmetsp:Transcript_25665/g.56557  ORF Transcript_25665/g.56557 Transcript_25665/m.56557 type:complete len:642 (+) Transcript_25665:71-1996(+)